ncbi:hypothetical protein NLJ89_g9237 [Agrocybe chaxingu]|uniref:Letm1 RBD domain-containing protein n=1 Tax=Agrocybe chaxingu TaxID=84603 RepID=A0A9W8K0C4_9AGAR|nr:hypothetical protein NLJ89_g9237 [Agrocybe chaxingu]
MSLSSPVFARSTDDDDEASLGLGLGEEEGYGGYEPRLRFRDVGEGTSTSAQRAQGGESKKEKEKEGKRPQRPTVRTTGLDSGSKDKEQARERGTHRERGGDGDRLRADLLGTGGGGDRDRDRDRERARTPRTPRGTRREEARGEWIVLDMGNEIAFNSILQILHRHFVPPIVSEFVPDAIAAMGLSPSINASVGVGAPVPLSKEKRKEGSAETAAVAKREREHAHASDADSEPPIKPKPAPQPSLLKAHRPLVVPPPAAPKLETAKQVAQHDIHDAEAHGILTPPPKDANWFKRTIHQAIQLLKFYYRGVKLIFSRRRDIAAIKARIAAGGPPLTRSEFRLFETQKDDIAKVVPFLVIALLLEEVIPLIAIYAPFMLPSTCILPSQRLRIEAKRAEKAQAFSSQYYGLISELRRREQPAGFLPLHALHVSGAPTAICGLLGLSTIGFDALRIRRVRRHLEFITRDDQLLLQDNATHGLSNRQLTEALQERGIISRGTSHSDLEARLSWWLNVVKDSSREINDEALARRLALVLSSR